MNNTTLMLAHSNSLGAPNSPEAPEVPGGLTDEFVVPSFTAGQPLLLSNLHINKKIIIDNRVALNATADATHHGYVQVGSTLITAFEQHGTEAMEITLQGSVATEAVVTFDAYTSTHSVTTAGVLPVYVLIPAVATHLDADEIVDNFFRNFDALGGNHHAIRLESPIASRRDITTIRLERKSPYIHGLGEIPLVKVSTDRVKASQRSFDVAASKDLTWTDFGSTLDLTVATTTLNLPDFITSAAGTTETQRGFSRLKKRGFELRTTVATTVTIAAGAGGNVRSAGTPAGAASVVITLPAFSRARIVLASAANDSMDLTWDVYE